MVWLKGVLLLLLSGCSLHFTKTEKCLLSLQVLMVSSELQPSHVEVCRYNATLLVSLHFKSISCWNVISWYKASMFWELDYISIFEECLLCRQEAMWAVTRNTVITSERWAEVVPYAFLLQQERSQMLIATLAKHSYTQSSHGYGCVCGFRISYTLITSLF